MQCFKMSACARHWSCLALQILAVSLLSNMLGHKTEQVQHTHSSPHMCGQGDPKLPPAPSGVSEGPTSLADTGHRMADLNLDDLLGLNDATPTAADAPADKAAVPSSPDPFAVAQVRCLSASPLLFWLTTAIQA